MSDTIGVEIGRLAVRRHRASARLRLTLAALTALVSLAASVPLATAAPASSSQSGTATEAGAKSASLCPQPTLPAASKPAAQPTSTTKSATTTGAASPTPPPAPTVSYPYPAVTTSGSSVTVNAFVQAGGEPGSAFVRFGESGFLRCSDHVGLNTDAGKVSVSVPLSGLTPGATYRFEVGSSTAGGVAYGSLRTFVAPGPTTVAAGVKVGPIELGGATKAGALKLLSGFLTGHLGFTFEDVYWSAPRAELGAEIDEAATVARAFSARPGAHLQLQLTVDARRLNAYLSRLGARFAHPAQTASIRLVGTRAVVRPAQPPVAVDLPLMASAVETALRSGLDERLRLLVDASADSHAAPTKAVVVRLGSQTLTAYLNGKPILKTPVTTGRPALPTPVGSYHVIFRASPFVFNSPWPPGSPFWYPPTPVTWAMDFFGGDFLHDDPGEPSNAFGAGSDFGPYASHGCVHVPHDVMAFLYNWLPVGAQVVVADD